jgi:hypothetical protein
MTSQLVRAGAARVLRSTRSLASHIAPAAGAASASAQYLTAAVPARSCSALNPAAATHRWISSTRTVAADASTQAEATAAISSATAASATAADLAADPAADSLSDKSAPPLPVPLFLRMPPIDGVGRCKVQRWCVSEGDAFDRGDVLLEIDSDLAVIEYKAQSEGILALQRAKVGDKIVDGQIIGVQVAAQEDRANAPAWLAHVERMARAEQKELDRLEKQEEAESDIVDELERQSTPAPGSDASSGSKGHHST